MTRSKIYAPEILLLGCKSVTVKNVVTLEGINEESIVLRRKNDMVVKVLFIMK